MPQKTKKRIKKIKRKEAKKISRKRKEKKRAKPEKISPEEAVKKIRIQVIGIGGGGCSIISEIANNLKRVNFVAANTDSRSLKGLNKKIKRFQFGQNLTYDLGTGMNAGLGQLAAENEKERIKNLLKDQDLCIIVASLGGGTGSGAAPVFAKISRSLGNITYGIFTLPFGFEGEKKAQTAQESLRKLKPYLNALNILPNEKIFQIIDKNTPLKEALSAINKNLSESLSGLIEMIHGAGLINIDFADLRTVLEGRGRLAYLNTIEFEREDQIEQAIKDVISSPLYPYSIQGARGILFNISDEGNLSLNNVSQVSNNIWKLVNPSAKIIFGVSQSKKLKGKMRVTLLASGCGTRTIISALLGKIKQKTEEKKAVPVKAAKAKRTTKKKKPALKKEKISPPKTPVLDEKKTKKTKPSAIKKKKTKKKKKEAKKEVSLPKKNQVPEINQEKLKQEPKEEPKNEKKIESSSGNPEEEIKVKVRRNGLQIKKAVEEAEKEILRQEEEWETPAFLRRQKSQ